MYHVIVVGGGPVGSQVAYRLAGFGHKVAVIDQKTDFGGPVCCTGIVSEECVREFEIDPRLIYRHVNSARVFSPSGKELRLRRGEPQAAVLDRARFNVFMAKRACDRGAEYLMGSRVTDVKIETDEVKIAIGDGGTGSLIAAKAAVIATGFRPELARSVGFGKPGDFVTGAQAEVETGSVEEIEVYLGKTFAPGLFAWLVPTSPGKALAGLLARHAAQDHLKDFLTFLSCTGKICKTDVRVRLGAVPLKAMASTCSDRLLVVGTAAGQVKPTTGGGIYYGLLCADMAAATLHRAFQTGDLSRRSLADYQSAWKAKLTKEFRTGRQARTIYRMLSDRRIDHIFDIMQTEGTVNALLREPDLSFDWHSQAVRHLLRQQTLAKLLKGGKGLFRKSREEKTTQKETEL